MVKHENIHRIERPLGVITNVYPDDRGTIRTVEVEESGQRYLRQVTYLVPLELDCHQDNSRERQRLREGEEGNLAEVISPVDSNNYDEPGDTLTPDASSQESTSNHTSGSSRENCISFGTNTGVAGTPNTPRLLPSPTPVLTQTSEGEVEVGEPAHIARRPRVAATRQRRLMRSLIEDDLI